MGRWRRRQDRVGRAVHAENWTRASAAHRRSIPSSTHTSGLNSLVPTHVSGHSSPLVVTSKLPTYFLFSSHGLLHTLQQPGGRSGASAGAQPGRLGGGKQWQAGSAVTACVNATQLGKHSEH